MGVAASAAIIALDSAHRARCLALIRGFEHDTATQQQRIEYADCIRYLAPVHLSPSMTVGLKVCIVIIILSMIAGVVHQFYNRDYSHRWTDVVFASFMWGLGSVIALMVIGLLAAGIWFLFT